MGIVGRIIQPGVTVTLHARPPGPRGYAELARSREMPSAAFAEGQRWARNMAQIDLFVRREGGARYVAIWIEGRIEAVGALRIVTPVEPGRVVYFPRGELRIEV